MMFLSFGFIKTQFIDKFFRPTLGKNKYHNRLMIEFVNPGSI
jgi:hypothetical protein